MLSVIHGWSVIESSCSQHHLVPMILVLKRVYGWINLIGEPLKNLNFGLICQNFMDSCSAWLNVIKIIKWMNQCSMNPCSQFEAQNWFKKSFCYPEDVFYRVWMNSNLMYSEEKNTVLYHFTFFHCWNNLF